FKVLNQFCDDLLHGASFGSRAASSSLSYLKDLCPVLVRRITAQGKLFRVCECYNPQQTQDIPDQEAAMRTPPMSAAGLTVLVFITQVAAYAQWLHYPTPGSPRTKDGKPNLTAPAPPRADGKPDLEGIWQLVVSQRSLARRAKEVVGPNLLDYVPEGTQ